jgi:hypothetical protein
MKKNAIKKMFLYLRYQKNKKKEADDSLLPRTSISDSLNDIYNRTNPCCYCRSGEFFIEKKQLIQIYSFNY